MRIITLITLLSLIDLISGINPVQAQIPSQSYHILVNLSIKPDYIDYATLSTALLRATNRIRTEQKLDTLLPDKYLSQSAGIQAEYLSKQKELIHLNYSDSQLRTPAKRVASTGADMQAVAENLARMSIYRLGKNGRFFVDEVGNPIDGDGIILSTLTYWELATKVTEGWWQSKGHRENLLGAYTHLGLAETKMMSGNGILTELVFVQNFGKY